MMKKSEPEVDLIVNDPMQKVASAMESLLADIFSNFYWICSDIVTQAIDILHYCLKKSRLFHSKSGKELKINLKVLQELLTDSKHFLTVFPLKPLTLLIATIDESIDETCFDQDSLLKMGQLIIDACEVIPKLNSDSVRYLFEQLSLNYSTSPAKQATNGYEFIKEFLKATKISGLKPSDDQARSNIALRITRYIVEISNPFKSQKFYKHIVAVCSFKELSEQFRDYFLRFSNIEWSYTLDYFIKFTETNPRAMELIKRFRSVYAGNMRFGFESLDSASNIIYSFLSKHEKIDATLMLDLFESALFPENDSYGSFVSKFADRLLPKLMDQVEGADEKEKSVNAGAVFTDMISMTRNLDDDLSSPFMSYCAKHDKNLGADFIQERVGIHSWINKNDLARNLDALNKELRWLPHIITQIVNKDSKPLLQTMIIFRLAKFKICFNVLKD